MGEDDEEEEMAEEGGEGDAMASEYRAVLGSERRDRGETQR